MKFPIQELCNVSSVGLHHDHTVLKNGATFPHGFFIDCSISGCSSKSSTLLGSTARPRVTAC